MSRYSRLPMSYGSKRRVRALKRQAWTASTQHIHCFHWDSLIVGIARLSCFVSNILLISQGSRWAKAFWLGMIGTTLRRNLLRWILGLRLLLKYMHRAYEYIDTSYRFLNYCVLCWIALWSIVSTSDSLGLSRFGVPLYLGYMILREEPGERSVREEPSLYLFIYLFTPIKLAQVLYLA